MPPHNEVIVSGGVALKSKDLICTIHSAFKGDELMSLSPYEMRNLLHHIMSGREFSIKKCQKYQSGYNIVSNNDRVSQNLQQSAKKHEMHKKTEDLVEEEDETSSEDDSEESGRQGTWLRKRRVDGALNRVPK